MNNLMPEIAGAPFYTLRVNGHDLVVDGSKKGRPGDVVVVWPVKGGPLVARRLARCTPLQQVLFSDAGRVPHAHSAVQQSPADPCGGRRLSVRPHVNKGPARKAGPACEPLAAQRAMQR